jgi:diadenosine tetraphosphate (Ap4A) HIT family hydrolase
MNNNCPFCKIDLNRTRIIDEGPKSLVILSNPALMQGHCLVVPKRHVEKISELDGEEWIDVVKELVKIEELLLKRYPGCDIRQNYRPFQQQNDLKVNHLHFHLQPRSLYDRLYDVSQVHEPKIFKFLDSDELDESKYFIFGR